MKRWVTIGNGDDNEAAQVIDAFPCADHGRSATVTNECSGKLRGAVIFF